MKTTVTALVALLAALALVAAGCGGSSEESGGTPTGQEEGSPEEAIEHIGEVRNQLASALAKYKAGDAEEADRIVGDAYLEEFEHIEEVLGEEDHELMEELEEAISTELRDKIKSGAPAAEVQELVESINDDLAKAEDVLKS